MFYLAAIGKGGAFMHRPEMWDRGTRGMEYWGHAGIHPFSFLWPLLVFVLLLVLTFLVIKLFAHKKTMHNTSNSKALEILKERYAN